MDDHMLNLKKVAKFPRPFPEIPPDKENDYLPEGGIFASGDYGWLTAGGYLEIVKIDSGAKVAQFHFANYFKNTTTIITTVVELNLTDFPRPVLAIGFRGQDSGYVCLFSVFNSRLLHFFEFTEPVTSIAYLAVASAQSVIGAFDGCLILGTNSGKTLLVDLELDVLRADLLSVTRVGDPVPILTIPADATDQDIRNCHAEATRQKVSFGLELKVLQDSGSVLSLLPLPVLNCLAVGLCDGRLVLYSLDHLDAFHLALPPKHESPLISLAFLEPADDPKACAYLWAFHDTPQMAIAVMHSLMFGRKTASDESHTTIRYEDFQSCRVRLTMPIQDRGSVPLSCQSVYRLPLLSAAAVEEDSSMTCVCLLTWRTERRTSMLMLFDLNQWYKEQMPWIGNWRESPSYVCVYPMPEDPLAVHLDEKSLAWFNSMDRPEEHFYPTAMAFDCLVLTSLAVHRMHWPGLQNRALHLLEQSGPSAILDPEMCYRAMLEAALVPQLTDEDFKLESPLATKRELLLSIALENNCIGLLKRCARVWADGSHMGKDPRLGLSLATITDWIWNRSRTIKQYCNTLCVPLFDYSGQLLGHVERKRLSHCGMQLRWLSEVMDMIVTTCDQYIPEEVLQILKEQYDSIRRAAEYQDVLIWLLNMGLLPEGLASAAVDGHQLAYPYDILNRFYATKRTHFFEADKKYATNPPWNSCKQLYIDALIERECGGVELYREWKMDGGTGLYPPRSLQSMLRLLLIPNVSTQSKYAVFMYLFLDLNLIYQDERDCAAEAQNLIKFPAVFKMPSDLIKITQSFWYLDHNDFESAVDDLKASALTCWQLELMVECLFVHQCAHLSIRALQMPGPKISPIIEMRVLLANNLIAEAFLFQKRRGNKELLTEFFNSSYRMGKLRSVLSLPLTEMEGKVLGEYLLSIDSSNAKNLHFVYLLQRAKYLEAVDFVEGLRTGGKSTVDTGPAAGLLSTYKLTMPPLYQELCDVYKKMNVRSMIMSPPKNKAKKESSAMPPITSQLIKNKMDVNGGIYRVAIAAVNDISPANGYESVPFLRRPLHDNMHDTYTSDMVYPKMVEEPIAKRNLTESEISESPAKRRRLEDINKSLLTSFQTPKSFIVAAANNSLASSTLRTPLVKRVTALRSNISNDSFSKLTPQSILRAQNIFRESSQPATEKVLRFGPTASSFFNESEIKEAAEPEAIKRKLPGPRPRRALRSATPEEKEARLMEGQNEVSAEPSLAREVRVTRSKSKEMAEMSPARAGRVTRSQSRESQEDEPEESEPARTSKEEEEEKIEKPEVYRPSPRRSLRSKTPELKTVTKTTSKKSLSRYVLESNTRKLIREEDEATGTEETRNVTLDSSLPQSDYSLNASERDPMLGDRTILADNSYVSDSVLREWRHRREKDTLEEPSATISSDISESVIIPDVLQKSDFIEEEVGVDDSEPQDSSNIEIEDCLQEDTVYLPERKNPLAEEDSAKEEAAVECPSIETSVGEAKVDEELPENVFLGSEMAEEAVAVDLETDEPEEGLGLVISSPVHVTAEESNPDPVFVTFNVEQSGENQLSELKPQETFIVAPKIVPVEEVDSNTSESNTDDYDDETEDSDGIHDSISDESNGLPLDSDDFDENEDVDDVDDVEDDEDDEYDEEYDEEEDEDESPKKAFQTNEVIDLLDSSNEEAPEEAPKEVIPEAEIPEKEQTVQLLEAKSNEIGEPEVTSTVPEVKDDVKNKPEVVSQEPLIIESEPTTESPFAVLVNVAAAQVPAAELMDQAEPDIYENMEVDVEMESESNALNDAIMMDCTTSSTGNDFEVSSSENVLNQGLLLESAMECEEVTTADETEGELNRAHIESLLKTEESVTVDPAEADYANREEVVEVIPPPKVAFVTTDNVVEKSEQLEQQNQVLQITPNLVVDKDQEEKPTANSEEPRPSDENALILEDNVKGDEAQATEIPEEPKAVDDAKVETNTNVGEPVDAEVVVDDVNKVVETEMKEAKRAEDLTVDEVELNLQISDNESRDKLPEATLKAETKKRSGRAASQPKSIPSSVVPAKIMKRRVTLETPGLLITPETSVTPRRSRRISQHMDTAEERAETPNLRLTPMRLSRMSTAAGSTDSLNSATTSKRVTRATSVESDATRTPRRGVSREQDDDAQSVVSNASRRSGGAKSTASSATTTATRRGQAARKKLIESTIPEEETEMEEYSATRRLTRNQLSVLERSMRLQKASTSAAAPPARRTSSATVDEAASAAVADSDDLESVSSKVSRTSTQQQQQPKRRSPRGRSKESDISESGASTTRSGRVLKAPSRRPSVSSSTPSLPATKKKLSAIAETDSTKAAESEDGNSSRSDRSASLTPTRKRPGRPRKGSETRE